MIKFDRTEAEDTAIRQIIDRAAGLGLIRKKDDRLSVYMDLAAVNANGCPMDFQRMLAADDFNFTHDLQGIRRYLDRDDQSPTAGQLLCLFLPRFAKKMERAA